MQQATCAHSGATTGASPGNSHPFSTNRRGIIGALAAAPLVFAVAPASAAPASDWAKAEARYNAACKAACDYFEAVYDPMWKEIDAKSGPRPPRFVEVFAKDGASVKYPTTADVEYPPFPSYDHCRAAQKLSSEWYEKRIALEAEPFRAAISDELDRLYEVEFAARKALMETRPPNQRAMALKIRLALEDGDFLPDDREHLLADASRILGG
ncbi:hypothetical protein [Sphingomonas aquatilis]|uniref:hypothetical protein n=1 Tax=Sphingomonas aquatilis TaxID=93063 RepID=UPI0023F84C75|nr:hypothetical protein [Sphingomonas aquatilis]MCI4653889.1 hypothetical protein [Sphingomonas aquatilis]